MAIRQSLNVLDTQSDVPTGVRVLKDNSSAYFYHSHI